jgi:hypothetical protein
VEWAALARVSSPIALPHKRRLIILTIGEVSDWSRDQRPIRHPPNLDGVRIRQRPKPTVLWHISMPRRKPALAGGRWCPNQFSIIPTPGPHTPRGAANASACRNASSPFRMEFLRGSISRARSPSRDNLMGLVGRQSFKHARAVAHPLTGGMSS